MILLRRWFWLVGLVVVLALVAAACDDDDDDGGEEPTEPPGATEPAGGGTPSAELKTDFGVTDTEIKLGLTIVQSGNPAAAVFAPIAPAMEAYFEKVNQEDGGVCNRNISLIVEDDQYAPATSLERARKLVEQDEILAFVGNVGTPPVTGQVVFVNDPDGDGDTSDGVPHLFLSTGAAKWNNPEMWPWTIGYIPDYISEGNVLAQQVNENFPDATAAILYQNDDFGEGGRDGFKEVFAGEIVAEEAYEANVTEITSQMTNIRDADPDIVYLYSLPLTTAQAISFMQANDWDPQVVWSYVNPNTLMAALLAQQGGNEAIAGTITTNYILDPVGDADDPAIVEHARIMDEFGGPDLAQLSVYGQSLAELAEETLKVACENGDMTRAGTLAAAESIQGFRSDLLLPGIEVNLSPEDHFALQALQPVELQPEGTLLALGDLVNVEE